ncbi:reverse transcriptase [Lasius niger]|uniref:Reverse transcriptase n=1 Tax=Lasius niger TaxID=67767 RepID=A0A0J7KH50_LASNI|nr:reverse transcriptase [Lasius niger]
MNTLGWKTSMFDPELFRAALDDGPIGEGSAMQKAEDVMRRVVKACDATMPRKRSTNRLPPMYWWNDTIASFRQECIRTRRMSQRGRKNPTPTSWTQSTRRHGDDSLKPSSAARGSVGTN